MHRIHAQRYEYWYTTPQGRYALYRKQELVRKFVSRWPRRSRSLLLMQAGSSELAGLLWECGFDVTVQDNDPYYLEQIRITMGERVGYALASPDYLPFNDCSFDYAVVVLEFIDDIGAAMQEVNRVTCGGCLVAFPNKYSAYYLESMLNTASFREQDFPSRFFSPTDVRAQLLEICGKATMAYGSVLLGASRTWRDGLWKKCNNMMLPLPVGAFAGIRVDWGALCSGTPLLLPSRHQRVPTVK